MAKTTRDFNDRQLAGDLRTITNQLAMKHLKALNAGTLT